MLLPLLLLFPLFLFRMMGAGDIKLLSVLGGLLGTGTILRSMICSFLLGALLSFAFLMACGNLSERLSYFLRYIRACSRHRRIRNQDVQSLKFAEFSRFAYIAVIFQERWITGTSAI